MTKKGTSKSLTNVQNLERNLERDLVKETLRETLRETVRETARETVWTILPWGTMGDGTWRAHRETSLQFLPKILWNNRPQLFIEVLCIFSTYLCIFTYLLIALHVSVCFVKLGFSKHAEFLTLWWLAGMRDLKKVLLNLLGNNYIERVFATQL